MLYNSRYCTEFGVGRGGAALKETLGWWSGIDKRSDEWSALMAVPAGLVGLQGGKVGKDSSDTKAAGGEVSGSVKALTCLYSFLSLLCRLCLFSCCSWALWRAGDLLFFPQLPPLASSPHCSKHCLLHSFA